MGTAALTAGKAINLPMNLLLQSAGQELDNRLLDQSRTSGQLLIMPAASLPEEDVMVEGESPANRWIREYNAKLMSFDQLADKIAGHKFKERKRKNSEPTMGRALDYRNADFEVGTFDDVYQARAFGLLTKQEMQTILERVEEAAASTDDDQRIN